MFKDGATVGWSLTLDSNVNGPYVLQVVKCSARRFAALKCFTGLLSPPGGQKKYPEWNAEEHVKSTVQRFSDTHADDRVQENHPISKPGVYFFVSSDNAGECALAEPRGSLPMLPQILVCSAERQIIAQN